MQTRKKAELIAYASEDSLEGTYYALKNGEAHSFPSRVVLGICCTAEMSPLEAVKAWAALSRPDLHLAAEAGISDAATCNCQT
jgi:hypothetical protein